MWLLAKDGVDDHQQRNGQPGSSVPDKNNAFPDGPLTSRIQ
jgi:hypothetical protein